MMGGGGNSFKSVGYGVGVLLFFVAVWLVAYSAVAVANLKAQHDGMWALIGNQVLAGQMAREARDRQANAPTAPSAPAPQSTP